jgi:hypothetical protein
MYTCLYLYIYIYIALGRFQEPKIGALQEDLKGSPVVIWNLRYIHIYTCIYIYKPSGNLESEVRLMIRTSTIYICILEYA